MESLTLLLAILRAIATSGSLAIAGIIVTRKGFINDNGRKCLAELSMNLLMPCLLFTSMVDCPPESLCAPVTQLVERCWVLLVLPLFTVGSGMALGKLVAVVTGCPPNFRKACVGAVAFANSTGMSITLLEVLSPTLQREGVIDEDALKFLPVYLLLYPMLQWSCGSYLFGLVRGPASEPEKEQPPHTSRAVNAVSRVNSTISAAVSRTLSVRLPELDFATEPDLYPTDQLTHHASLEREREQAILSSAADLDPEACSRAHTLGSTRAEGSRDVSAPRAPALASGDSEGESESTDPALCPESDCSRCCRDGCSQKLEGMRKLIRNALVPPVIGSALGLLVALIRPVQALFVDIHGGHGNAPLAFLFKAMLTIGKASVPVNMLVLGSNLSKGCDFKAIPLSTNMGILLMKNLGQPMMMVLLIALLSRAITNNLTIWLVALIVSCTPTANNIMVMVELSGQNKPGMTACIFTQYMAAPVVLTAVVWLFLLKQDLIVPQA